MRRSRSYTTTAAIILLLGLTFQAGLRVTTASTTDTSSTSTDESATISSISSMSTDDSATISSISPMSTDDSTTISGISSTDASTTIASTPSMATEASTTIASTPSMVTEASTTITTTPSMATEASTTITTTPSMATEASTTITTTPLTPTTTLPSLTENEILEDIKVELNNIQTSLGDLQDYINSLITVAPETTMEQATAFSVTKIGLMRRQSRKLLEFTKTGTDICTPVNGDETDLCSQMIFLLDRVQNFTTQFMNDDDPNMSDLEEIKNSSQQLNALVSLVKLDSDFVVTYKVNIEAFNDRISDVTEAVDNAIDEADAKIAENNESNLSDPEILVIVIGSVCGVLILAIVILAVYIGVKNSQIRKMNKRRKLNEMPEPTQAFDERGYDNRGLVAEESLTERPLMGPPTGGMQRSYREDGNVSRTYDAAEAASRRPHQEPPAVTIPRVGSPSRWSTGQSSSAYDPDQSDPYSLEQRGANVKRVTSGGLRRIDQY